MLKFTGLTENKWMPDAICEEEIDNMCINITGGNGKMEMLYVFKTEPYIDSLYISSIGEAEFKTLLKKRFTFHENYRWSYEDEQFFYTHCLHNERLNYNYGAMDAIYAYYSEKYPDWKLKRYYTRPLRLLDHIYHCMQMGTAREMLYKSGLDELAAHIDSMDGISMFSNRPSDIYEGISMRTLRAMNCREGADLLSKASYRDFIREIQSKFPDVFRDRLNGAQCQYLQFLIDGDLTVGEAGRLFCARKMDLIMIWSEDQYKTFLRKENLSREIVEKAETIKQIDPIYRDYIGKVEFKNITEINRKITMLNYYLLEQRENYDLKIRRSNRRRDQQWQERDKGYVVRFPQTINDFCRESVYMCNCLLTYAEALVNNDTTILYVRKCDDFNTPFITMEIYKNELMQAYHRFNEDCTYEEAKWIKAYCDRHGIGRDRFKFNRDIDLLF